MKSLLLSTILSIFLSVSAAHATIITAFDINVTVNVPEVGSADTYALALGIDNWAPLTPIYNINSLNRIEPLPTNMLSKLINMLQRTYTPDADITQDEEWAMYKSNQVYGMIALDGAFNSPGSSRWFVYPLPDLSAYRINALYADNFSTIHETTADLDTRILADVTPVPEPSSLLLVAFGIAGIAFLKKKFKSDLVL